MPNIVLCRIDERLIHGQVGVQWVGLRGEPGSGGE
jgi:PTS system N-acetylgalactosamine-specific IIB component